MADFSKQYCESKFPEHGGDFDIIELAKEIGPGQYMPMICEGYGFIAIGKDDDGSLMLAFTEETNPTPSIVWKPYDEVIV